jgi:spore coat protein U-like protein
MVHAILSRFVRTALLAGGVAVLATGPATAATVNTSGTINVTLTVTAACAVNGATSIPASLGQLGTIDFGSQPGLFGTTDASLVASGGTSGLTILCSPGLSPTLTIDGGQHVAGQVRNLLGAGTQLPYRLYSTAGTSNEILVGQPVSFGNTSAGVPITMPIHATTSSGGAVLAAGTYTDQLSATLSW